MAYVNGMMISLAMGALSYYLYAKAAGEQLNKSWNSLSLMGIGNCGLMKRSAGVGKLRIFDSAQGSNRVPIVNKVTSFSGGPRTKTIGSGSLVDELGGPSLDLLNKLGKVLQSADWDEPNMGMTRNELHTARQLYHFENLFYTRRLLDQIENATSDAFGIPGEPR